MNRRVKSKITVVSAVIVAGGLTLSGCNSTSSTSSAGSNGSGGTVTVLAEDISYTNNMKAMLPTFEKETGIKVKIETVPYADMTAKSLLNFSQKSSNYDVFFHDTSYGSGYYESHFVENLVPFEKDAKNYNSFDQFYPPYMKAVTNGPAVYGLPVYGESTWLMYRTDLFKQYGINGPPKTMQELGEDAKTIFEKSGGKTYGITLRGAPTAAVYAWCGFLRAFGGDFYDSNKKLAINSDAAVKATEFYVKVLKSYGPPGAANFTWEQNRIAFTQGTAAMTIDATANGPFNEDPSQSKIVGKVGYAAVPYAVSAPIASDNSLDVHALYLSSFSKNKTAAYKFMAWATSKAVQDNAVKTSEAVGVTLTSTLNSPEYDKKYGSFKDAVLSQLKTGNLDYMPRGQNASAIIVAVGQAFSQALAGELTAKQALDKAEEQLNKQLK
jgi:multiple sugar transport system substrate-binding protein